MPRERIHENSVNLNIKVDAAFKDQLKKTADITGISISRIVRDGALEQIEKLARRHPRLRRELEQEEIAA
ncbi:MAG: hypothetical protein U0Z53_23815 [Blastocatellia bacterium]